MTESNPSRDLSKAVGPLLSDDLSERISNNKPGAEVMLKEGQLEEILSAMTATAIQRQNITMDMLNDLHEPEGSIDTTALNGKELQAERDNRLVYYALHGKQLTDNTPVQAWIGDTSENIDKFYNHWFDNVDGQLQIKQERKREQEKKKDEIKAEKKKLEAELAVAEQALARAAANLRNIDQSTDNINKGRIYSEYYQAATLVKDISDKIRGLGVVADAIEDVFLAAV